jgi:hypothetical protein
MKRPVTPTLKNRYAGHAAVNDQVREDWMKVIEQDPFSYEALLYRPTVPVPTEPDEDGIDTPCLLRSITTGRSWTTSTGSGYSARLPRSENNFRR